MPVLQTDLLQYRRSSGYNSLNLCCFKVINTPYKYIKAT